jgi:hypothetical protein
MAVAGFRARPRHASCVVARGDRSIPRARDCVARLTVTSRRLRLFTLARRSFAASARALLSPVSLAVTQPNRCRVPLPMPLAIPLSDTHHPPSSQRHHPLHHKQEHRNQPNKTLRNHGPVYRLVGRAAASHAWGSVDATMRAGNDGALSAGNKLPATLRRRGLPSRSTPTTRLPSARRGLCKNSRIRTASRTKEKWHSQKRSWRRWAMSPGGSVEIREHPPGSISTIVQHRDGSVSISSSLDLLQQFGPRATSAIALRGDSADESRGYRSTSRGQSTWSTTSSPGAVRCSTRAIGSWVSVQVAMRTEQ